MRSSDCLVVVPPIVSVIQEFLNGFMLILALQIDLFVNMLLCKELISRQRRYEV